MTVIWIAIAVLAVALVALAYDAKEFRGRVRAAEKDIRHVSEGVNRHEIELCDQIRDILGAHVRACEVGLDLVCILDHLGLEIQEPTTMTTPRRLVPKERHE